MRTTISLAVLMITAAGLAFASDEGSALADAAKRAADYAPFVTSQRDLSAREVSAAKAAAPARRGQTSKEYKAETAARIAAAVKTHGVDYDADDAVAFDKTISAASDDTGRSWTITRTFWVPVVAKKLSCHVTLVDSSIAGQDKRDSCACDSFSGAR